MTTANTAAAAADHVTETDNVIGRDNDMSRDVRSMTSSTPW